MIRYRYVFVGDDVPAPDHTYRTEALTVGQTVVYLASRWVVMEISDADTPLAVLKRRLRQS